MLRLPILEETTAAEVLGGGGGPNDPPVQAPPEGPAAEGPPPVEAPVEAAPTEGEPGPVTLSPEELGQLIAEASSQGTRGSLEQLLSEAAAHEEANHEQEPTELPEWNPFDPEVVGSHMESMFERFAQEHIAPILQELEGLRETRQTVLADQGERNANSIFDRLAGEIGDFDRERALERAAWLADAGVDPRQAVDQAARDVAAYEARIGQAAVARYTGQEQNLETAPVTPAPAAATGAEVVEMPTGEDRYRLQLQRSKERLGMTRQPGVTG